MLLELEKRRSGLAAGQGAGRPGTSKLRVFKRAGFGTRPPRRTALVSALVIGLGLMLLMGECYGQRLGGGKHFKLAENYGPPDDNQIKSLLEAAAGQQLEDGRYLLTEVVLRTYLKNGQSEMRVAAPQCVYDPGAQDARSPGPMSMQSADDKFSIEGVGFLWVQTNSTLFISNRVHTTVQPELLESSGRNGRPPDRAGKPGLEIFSDRFMYDGNSGRGVYDRHMHAAGTNWNLVGQSLTVVMPRPEPGKPAALETIVAEGNVALDYTNANRLHATGERAVYTSGTGLITVTGQPAWESEQREGTAEEIIIDRTNRIFLANGNAVLRVPGQGVAAFGFLSSSNAANRNSGGTSNHLVEIRSERYRFETNRAVFRNQVRVTDRVAGQARGTMDCSLLTATFAGSNQLDSFVAQTNVVIAHDDARLHGALAVYTASNSILEVTGDPGWEAGLRQGRGHVVRVNTQTNEMFVRGRAWMRLPAEQVASSATLAPGGSKPPPKSTGPEFAEITCREYTVRPESAVFRGGVQSTHPQLNVACETLTVGMPPPGAAPRTLSAHGKVVFDVLDEKGQKYHGIGQEAFYTNGIVGGLTNDTLTLVGGPATVRTTNSTFENKLFILDRAKGVLIMPGGEYNLKGTAPPIDTNQFRLPKK